MALTLYGVTANETHSARLERADTELVVVRELAAVCGPTDYRLTEPTDERVGASAEIVRALAARGPVLPAPIGIVFRTEEQVSRWLELHYVALAAALDFVENRVAARLHVWRSGDPDEREIGADLATVAADSMRTLRRAAVLSVPLRAEKLTGIVLSSAFLVEEELWKEFGSRVEQEARREPSLRFELTGPWPPYDFVRMELRG